MSNEIAALAKRLRDLAKVPQQILKPAAEEIASSMQSEFERGADPYGNQWAPLKSGKRSHLTKTGALRKSATAHAHGDDTIFVVADDEKAVLHQDGTSRMPARPMLPKPGDMPDEWRKLIAREYELGVRNTLRK